MAPLMPLISVIIPCYNYAHFLPDAINSVLNQQKNGQPIEIIIVDDGSSDNTAAVAQGFAGKIRYIHQSNQGLSAARNTGIRAARGDYLVFLDADDLLTPGTLASQLDNFTAHPELDLSVCLSLQTVQHKDNSEKYSCYLWPLKCAHLDMHICHSTVSPIHTFMLRAEAVQAIGFFNTDLKACEDHDYWLRCATQGQRIGINPHALVIYRQHGSSMINFKSQQLAHSAALRFKISTLLKNNPQFPQAGKFFGWLAHAAGTIRSAYDIHSSSSQFALKLLEESIQAILKAATLTAMVKTEDHHLILAEQFFSASFLLMAKKFSHVAVKQLQQSIDFIIYRYPQLSMLSSNMLHEQQKKLLQSLCCSQEQVQMTIKEKIKLNSY